MEEEINKKKLINSQLENLISMLNEADKKEDNIESFKWFISIVSEDYKEQKGLYKKCISELLNIQDLNNIDYLESAKDICNYFYNCSNGKIYDETTYVNKYRKEHYKQLNVDIPISLMEDLEHCLKYTGQTKKQFIIKAINEFLNNCKK